MLPRHRGADRAAAGAGPEAAGLQQGPHGGVEPGRRRDGGTAVHPVHLVGTKTTASTASAVGTTAKTTITTTAAAADTVSTIARAFAVTPLPEKRSTEQRCQGSADLPVKPHLNALVVAVGDSTH